MDRFNRIIEILGKSYFRNEDTLIYNMDCQTALNMLQGNIEIDTSITSPPYNIGKEYEELMTVDEYINWLGNINELIYNITKRDGNYLLNIGYLKVEGKGRAVPIAYLLWDKSSFFLNQEIVWNYGAGVATKKYLSPRNEKILWYVKDPDNYTFNLDPIRDPDIKYPNQKKKGKLRCNTLGKNPSDVWQIAKVTSGTDRSSKERSDHPAQFPEDMINRLVLGFSNENDLILDPFIGSGTTARCAMMNNRRCIGFEINERYCEVLKEKLIKTEKEIKIKNSMQTLF